MSPPLGCSLLLKIPSGSSFEFTLRKLKLLRPHSRECREDSQLQLATSTTWEPHKMMTDTKHFNSLHSSTWPNLAENHHWQVVRTFCGKIQDYSKSLRTWHTFEPWVLIRYRSSQRAHHHILSSNGISNSFVLFKFNILGPCLNVLLTERSKTIEFSESDLSASVPECTFRVHVPYGYRIHLSAHLTSDNAIVPYENEAVDHPAVGRADESDENSLFTTNGDCQMTVQAEDITGHQTKCLNHRNPTASFSSLANFLKFQAKMLQVTSQGRPTQICEKSSVKNFRCMLKDKLRGIFRIFISGMLEIKTGEEELKQFSNNSYGKAAVIPGSSVRLSVRYFSEADPRLTNGCGEGVLADETTCIWLHPEPLTWHEAEAKCSQMAPNGHLVAITSPEIQKVVDAVITKR
jgi:hypothetical protein